MANAARVVDRIVSGGQTGVDRAALDVALGLGLPCGGWCPRGRRAEDGALDPRYPLVETPSDDYAQRTAWNVRDSDATLVLTRGEPTGGTAFTIEAARRLGRPVRVEDLGAEPDPSRVRAWIRSTSSRRLNVAGPRESGMPGIYQEALGFLRQVLSPGAEPSTSGP
jgi:Circularly permutated YpsA SLOG family